MGILGHMHMPEAQTGGRGLPGDRRLRGRGHRLREAKPGQGAQSPMPEPGAHGFGSGFAGTRMPVTIRPGPESPCRIVATSFGVTAAIRCGHAARSS